MLPKELDDWQVAVLRRHEEGAGAVLHAPVVRPHLQEEPDHPRMPVLRRDEERRGAAPVWPVQTTVLPAVIE